MNVRDSCLGRTPSEGSQLRTSDQLRSTLAGMGCCPNQSTPPVVVRSPDSGATISKVEDDQTGFGLWEPMHSSRCTASC